MNIFKSISNFFNSLIEPSEHEKEEAMVAYFKQVDEYAKNNMPVTFSTWTPEGFNRTMEILINKIETSFYAFIDCRELFFDSLKLNLLERKLQRLTENGGECIIITYNGQKDSIFKQLEEKYSSFKYIAATVKNPNEINNFVVVNKQSYFIEDTIYKRKNINDILKAEINFFNFSKTSTLLDNFNKYLEILSDEEK